MAFHARARSRLVVLAAFLVSAVLALSIGFDIPAHANASATDPRWYQDNRTGNQYTGVQIVSTDQCTYLIWKFDLANPSWSINTTPTGDNALAGNAAQYFDYYDGGHLYNGLARRARSNPQLISDASFAPNSQAPQAGDLLVFQELNNPNNWTQGLYHGVDYSQPGYPQGLSNSPGHVAIVTGLHDGNVYFAEQNAGSAHDFGSTTITWTSNGWHVAVPSFLGYTNRVLRGWIHYPANHGNTDGLQLLAVSNGAIYHTIRHSDGSWQTFGNVDGVAGNPGLVTAIASAEVNGELQVVAVSNGIVYHTIRHSDGSWQAFGDVDTVAGNPGPVDEIAAAGIGGDLHVVVDVGGQIYHTIRHSNGSWDAFVNIDTVLAVPGYVQSVAIANVNGELQVVIAVGYQVATQVYHTIRHSNGTWQAFGDVYGVAGNPGAADAIAAAGIGGDLQVAVDVGGQIYHTIRHSDGSWQAFGYVDAHAGNPGFADTLAAASINGELQLVVEVNGQIYHTIRHSDGSWQTFGDVDTVAGNPGPVAQLAAA